MVDVTVDAKPMAKLPIDPSTIPDAVKRRAAAVDALYANGGNGEAPQPPSEPPAQPLQPPPPVQPEPPPPAPQTQSEPPLETPRQPERTERASASEPAPSKEDNSETWRSRYAGLQGRYTAAQRTIGEMQEQMTQLGSELLQVQQAVSSPRNQARHEPAQPPPSYLTEQDVQNYGSDLVDFTQRAAAHALAPTLAQIEAQNAELQRRLAVEARRGLDQRVELAIPNYREIDQDPRWRRWLLGIDLFSGRVRQQLLNEAIAAADAPRAISFFRGFLQEEVATGHSEPPPSYLPAPPRRDPAVDLGSLAAPGRARPATGGDASVPSDKPTYTRVQIAQLYSAYRKGAYVGREAEWARQEADIIAAGRERRVIL